MNRIDLKRRLLRAVLPLLCFLWLTPAMAGNLEDTVEHLIDYVSASEVTFVRNGSEYSGAEAATHIRVKYRHFSKEIDSPEKFIALCASRSLLTGRDYYIVGDGGERMPASEWLLAALDAYRRGQGE